MDFKEHLELKNKHALLGGSRYQWLSYSDEDIQSILFNQYKVTLGTWLHAFAATAIKRSIRLPRNKKTLIQMIEFFFDGQKDSDNPCPKGVFNSLIFLGDEVFSTLVSYVNDAIGFRMTPEVILKYSDICFGTADSVSYRDGFLRIHDLKTGSISAKMNQLYIYAGLFLLDYKIEPQDIQGCEFRIYQGGTINTVSPSLDELKGVTNKIIHANSIIQKQIDMEE